MTTQVELPPKSVQWDAWRVAIWRITASENKDMPSLDRLRPFWLRGFTAEDAWREFQIENQTVRQFKANGEFETRWYYTLALNQNR